MKKIIMKNWLFTGIFCVVAIIANFAIYNLLHELLTHIHVEQRLAETAGRIIASLGILAFYSKYFDIESFGIKKENFFHGLITGGFMALVSINNLAASILEFSDYPVIEPSLYLIFIVVIEQIFVGVFEEFLFRGLILNTLLKKLQSDQYKNKMIAIVISSLLFGSVHLLNLFSEPQMLYATIDQVFYASFIGIFLGALYLRTNNIWVVVFYHFIYDLVSELPVIFHEIPAQGLVDETISVAVLNICANMAFVLAALFIARKLKDKK